MSAPIGALLFLAATMAPAKGWFAPSQPLRIEVKTNEPATLVLSDYSGRTLDAKGKTDVTGDTVVDLRDVFVAVQTPGAYVLYLTKKQETPEELLDKGVDPALVEKARAALMTPGVPKDFLATPLVIGVREDRRRGGPPGPMVVRVEPLRYAVIHTDAGAITVGFYYDVAPHTIDNFLALAEQGFYDGLALHRVIPGFIVQGGDPRGDSTGGPGYTIDAEFSTRPHEAGALSMARSSDPGEAPGVMPRPEYANSAGSQFFICLDHANTRQLDGRYTVFGKVTSGMDVVKKIAAAPLTNDRSETPKEPQVIRKVEVKPVTPENNPYGEIIRPRDVTREVKTGAGKKIEDRG